MIVLLILCLFFDPRNHKWSCRSSDCPFHKVSSFHISFHKLAVKNFLDPLPFDRSALLPIIERYPSKVEGPMVSDRNRTNQNDEQYSYKNADFVLNRCFSKDQIKNTTSIASGRINFLPKNKRWLIGQNIPDHSSKYRRHHTHIQSDEDRKSTRLNSSHVASSYAVFFLKKKNTDEGSDAEGIELIA